MPRPPANARRTRQLAAIHAAAKQLGMDDDTRRDLMCRLTGQRSAAALDDWGRAVVLAELRRLGANHPSGRKPGRHPGKPHNMTARPPLTRIEQLLAEMGLSWAYADGIAKQMFRIERCAFLAGPQLRAVIAALYREQKRRAADPARSLR